MNEPDLPDIELPVDYEPRDYQLPLLRAMDGGCKRAVMLWHRRCGKDITALNFIIKRMWEVKGVYFYIFPTYAQARKVIWDSITNTGHKMLDYFWEPIVEKINHSEMKVWLKNGSLFQLVGSDKYDDLMGTNPRGIVFSEYAIQNPKAWEFIKPILRVNGGWALFISTPRGHNHFYDLWGMALREERWFTLKITNDDTQLLTDEELDEERREGMSEEMIQQEFYCSFEMGIEGTVYGRCVDAIRKDGRIGKVPYQRTADVETFWDLGFGDATAIIFTQTIGPELHIIDYYENNGEGLAHYVKLLQDKGYIYGKHWAPHDVENGHLSTGQTLRNYALELGIKFHVVPKTAIDFGVECGRTAFDTAWFDEIKCERLIKCLENYQYRYNEKMHCYSNTPQHDQWSDGCDAWRYMALARRMFGKSGKLTKARIEDMRDRTMGGGKINKPPMFPHEGGPGPLTFM